jgi:membrane-bound serine protease (ClpP class)
MEQMLNEILINPLASILLLGLIFLGMVLELRAPGKKWPSLMALAAGFLFFIPHFLEGHVAYWEILIFILGCVLLALEVFVIPGFGIAGISGIILLVLGLTLSLLENQGFDFRETDTSEVLGALAVVLGSLVLATAGGVWLAGNLLHDSPAHPLVEAGSEDKEEGYTVFDKSLHLHVGKEFLAVTDLRPVGYVEDESGRLEAVSEGDWIDRGCTVIATGVKELNLVVRKIRDPI